MPRSRPCLVSQNKKGFAYPWVKLAVLININSNTTTPTAQNKTYPINVSSTAHIVAKRARRRHARQQGTPVHHCRDFPTHSSLKRSVLRPRVHSERTHSIQTAIIPRNVNKIRTLYDASAVEDVCRRRGQESSIKGDGRAGRVESGRFVVNGMQTNTRRSDT